MFEEIEKRRENRRMVGWTLTWLAVMPPIAVVLWRVATMPWGAI